LVVCIGEATRLSEYVMASSKTYIGTIRLGQTTNTYDAEGEILSQYAPDHLTESDIRQALIAFQGEVEQIPPMFSALKQGGRKLYELARAGQEVERAARRVHMETELLSFQPPDITVRVTCSPGTYIRSIAHDLGAALAVGGHLCALRRTQSGALDNPHPWEVIGAHMAGGTLSDLLVDERLALSSIPALVVGEEDARRISHGLAMTGQATAMPLYRAYGPDNHFLAILTGGQSGQLHPHKVFPPRADR
jgi:tRNA pseudouridine55 synthase